MSNWRLPLILSMLCVSFGLQQAGYLIEKSNNTNQSDKKIKGLILAAGRGRRIEKKTKDIPKCLIKIRNKTILEYQLEALIKNKINDIVIVVGYKSEMIKNYISSQPKFNNLKITYVHNNDFATTNSGYSFWLARDHLKHNSFVHLNADVVFFPELVNRIKNSKYQNMILVDTEVKLDLSMEWVILDGDRITVMDKGNLNHPDGRGSGMAKLSPKASSLMFEEAENLISQGNLNFACHGLMRNALKKVDFHALKGENSFFSEINNLKELNDAKRLMDSLRRKAKT